MPAASRTAGTHAVRRAFVGIGNRGLVARGVVFVIVGGFLLYAVYRYDPDQAGGLAEALRWLRDQDYGRALFFIVAAGLVSFGAYSLIEAVWRKVAGHRPGQGLPVSGQ
jgi:hypothetical protein